MRIALRAGTARKNRTIEANSLPPNGRQKSRGQSLVEFALILPLFTVIMLAASDFGRAFSTYIAISNAAREGAIFAAVSGKRCDVAGGSRDDYADFAQAEFGSSPILWGDPIAPPTCSTGFEDPGTFGVDVTYEWVQVRVDYTFSPLFPFGPIQDVAMSRQVRMRVIS